MLTFITRLCWGFCLARIAISVEKEVNMPPVPGWLQSSCIDATGFIPPPPPISSPTPYSMLGLPCAAVADPSTQHNVRATLSRGWGVADPFNRPMVVQRIRPVPLKVNRRHLESACYGRFRSEPRVGIGMVRSVPFFAPFCVVRFHLASSHASPSGNGSAKTPEGPASNHVS